MEAMLIVEVDGAIHGQGGNLCWTNAEQKT